MTVIGRTSSDSSVDEQESTVSSNSAPRKSLDELLSQNKKMRELPSGSDFADMPSLSSYRAVDLSGSQASSLKGDCDMSLPSLSSFRMDDLSISSSYHSNYSNTNHLSGEESAEGWASFTSGNVSAETDSDADDDESEFATKSSPSDDRGKKQTDIDLTMLPMRARSRSPPSPDVDVEDEDDYEDSLNDHEEGGSATNRNLASNARPPPRRTPEPEETQGSLPMRRPTRTVSPPRDERPSEPETSAQPYVAATASASATVTTVVDSTPSTINARPPPRRFSSSPDRSQPVERTESFLLSMLGRPAKECSGSSSTLRTGTGTEGSSSSLRGGDSLPRLPRRTTTMDDHPRPNAEGEDDDDDTRTSEGDDNTSISDDELTKVSGDDISIESMSDFSIDTNDENDSVEEDVEAIPACERKSPSKKVATTTGDGEQSQQVDQLLEERNDQTERIEVAAAVAPENSTEGGGTVENPPAVNPNRKSPTSVRSIEQQTSSEKSPDESGTTSAEESGTSATETEVDESEEVNTAKDKQGGDKKDEKKRGKLLKRVSSSFRSLGKTASFRNSFIRIGKTASKLKQMGRKDDKNSSQPLPKRSQTQQDESSKDV
jgi:hypothetical protein